MKRKITLLVLSTIFATAVFCQIKVESSGKTTIGTATSGLTYGFPENTQMQSVLYGPVMVRGSYRNYSPSLTLYDSANNDYFCFLGKDADGTFRLSASESLKMGTKSRSDGFTISGNSIFTDLTFSGRLFRGVLSGGFMVNCNIMANGVYLTSDAKIKKDIKPLDSTPLSKLNQLNAVSYKIDKKKVLTANIFESGNAFEEYNESLTEDDKIHFGFIAQDVEKLFPNLIQKDDSTGTIYVNYIEFIPLLIESQRTQKAEITRLQTLVDDLLSKKAGRQSMIQIAKDSFSKIITGNESILSEHNFPTLEQNTPNPFSQSTQIRYYLPETVINASIRIYDLQGKQLKQIQLTQRGEGVETISGSQLAPGMYLYALIVDGQEADVKRMTLTE